MSVRVRFAPSPTGLLHVGALRTVLFDHLFAKRHQGQNILRIEDTDRSRYNEESEKEFVATLRWIGIEFDEGPHIGGPCAPYRQSERKAAGVYEPHIQAILASGHAYKAFDTPKELEEMREIQQVNKLPVGYFGGKWRDATPEQVAEAEAAGLPYVVRQRIPRDRKIECWDAVRGRIEVDSNTLTDQVLIKADGMPTYHFAAMVDDHLMGITHVLRGEEWLPTFPVHWLLFEAFGWDRPVFVHCPVIVGNDGKKLSKRHGATRVLDYGAQGYTPEAIKNFIALIGWSPGDEREVMSEAEMIEAFSLGRLQPSPGRFDIEKLSWLNAHRIRQMDPSDLLDAIVDYVKQPFVRNYHILNGFSDGLKALYATGRYVPIAPEAETFLIEKFDQEVSAVRAAAGSATTDALRQAIQRFFDQFQRDHLSGTEPEDFEIFWRGLHAKLDQLDRIVAMEAVDRPYVLAAVKEEQERVQTLADFGEAMEFFLVEEPPMDPKAVAKWFKEPHVGEMFDWILDKLSQSRVETVEHYSAILKGYQTHKGLEKLGPVVHPTRVALTGKTYGPGLFELMAVLGHDRIERRLRRAKAMLHGGS